MASRGCEKNTAWGFRPLQEPDGEVLLGDGVGVLGLDGAVERIDLLAQHLALQSAAGFALFFRGHALGQYCVRQKRLACVVRQTAWLAIVLARIVVFSSPAKKSETCFRPR